MRPRRRCNWPNVSTGFGYHAAADGVTALFVLLAALLAVLMTLYGMVRGLAAPGRLMALILLAEAALMAMLVTMNLLWFALFSVLELAVAAYLIGHWSTSTGENRSAGDDALPAVPGRRRGCCSPAA